MERVTVHCYQWDVIDAEEADENVHIHAWCLDTQSNPYLLRIEDFPAFCHVELPKYVDGRPFVWSQSSVDRYVRWLYYVLGEHQPIRVLYKECPKVYFYRGPDVKFPMLMLAFRNLRAMQHCERLLAKAYRISDLGLVNASVWETSISIVRKLLTTKHCGFSQWFTVDGRRVEEDLALSTLTREYIVDWSSLTPLDPVQTKGWTSRPRILAFDIETYSNNHKAFPNQHHALHVAYMISVIYQRVGDKTTRKRYGIIMGDCNEIYEDARPDMRFAEIIRVKSEVELIEAFARLVRELDPEIISGYNILGFDYAYLDARLRRRDYTWPEMGRIKGKPAYLTTKTWKSSAYGWNKINILHMEGRISIDMLPLIKRDYKLDKYDLDFVARYFLDGHGKHDVKAAEMFRIFEQNRQATAAWIQAGQPEFGPEKDQYERGKEEMTRVMRYCLQDAELVVDLFDKLNIWIALVEMSNIVGVSVMDLFTHGQQIRCVSQIYDLAANLGFVVDKRDVPKVHFSGGFVYEPLPGLYENVICLDFASLYPSIIMAYNICYSTLVPAELEDRVPDEICNVIEFDQEEEDLEDDDEIGDHETKRKKATTTSIKHYRYKFVKTEIREGILPQLVKKLVNERRTVRRQLDGVQNPETEEWITPPEPDPVTRVILDKRQLALKVSANSMFGFLGAQGGKLPLIEGARCVTAIGRQLIAKVNTYLKEKYRARIVYNDTDSSMIDLGLREAREAPAWGLRLSQEISGVKKGQKLWDGSVAERDIPGLFPPPLAMEFEKAMRLLALKKKKYCAFILGKDGQFVKNKKTGENDILKRGVVLARRDNCKYLRKVYEKVLLQILHRNPIEVAMDSIVDAVDDLVSGRVNWRELLVIRELGSYAPDSPYFMKAFADELRRSGKPAQPGDRIEYLVTNVPGQSKVGLKMKSVETFVEAEEAGTPLEVDYSYYIEKQLMNPLEQLMQVAYHEELARLDTCFGPGKIGYKPRGRYKFIPIRKPVKLMLAMIRDGQSVTQVKDWFRNVMAQARTQPITLRIVA